MYRELGIKTQKRMHVVLTVTKQASDWSEQSSESSPRAQVPLLPPRWDGAAAAEAGMAEAVAGAREAATSPVAS